MQLALAIPVDQRPFVVYQRLLDVSFREAMLHAAGGRAVLATRQNDEMVVRREVETAVPPQLRNFLKQWNLIVQTEQWQWDEAAATGSGQISIKIQGVPLSIDGVATITAVQEGSSVALDLLSYCGVPFVGPTLARAAAQIVQKNLEAELDYLAQNGSISSS